MIEASSGAARLRADIISEIHRLAEAAGGLAPGRAAFERATGVREAQWRGVLWARWSDAVREAGLEPNVRQQRFDSRQLLGQLLPAIRHYRGIPTASEMALYRRQHPSSPAYETVRRHFPTTADLVEAVRRRGETDATVVDVLELLPEVPTAEPVSTSASVTADGLVYLIKSGDHYKIGRSENLERRVKQVSVALPQPLTLEHAIRTDDPAGIEAYWHRRFEAKRMNGEWFKLDRADVVAFKRRKFM